MVLGRVFFAGEVGRTAGDGQEIGSAPWSEGRRFAKFGMAVYGPAKITIRVANGNDPDVAIYKWAPDDVEPETRNRVIQVVQPGTCDDPWQFFPGGLLFRKPTCARIEIADGLREARLRFGLGRECAPTER